MEKYFTVTEESQLHHEWFAYTENLQSIRHLVKQFAIENEIEATEFYADNDALYIVPSSKDLETFKPVLCAPLENGLRQFRKSSKISKSWVKRLADENLKVLHKPMVILYFKGFGGRYRSRIFDQDGKLYCSIDPAHEETPTGFVEMKASEFFKVIEEREPSNGE